MYMVMIVALGVSVRRGSLHWLGRHDEAALALLRFAQNAFTFSEIIFLAAALSFRRFRVGWDFVLGGPGRALAALFPARAPAARCRASIWVLRV